MQNRSSRGGVSKQRGKWRGRWYENGVKKSATLGLVSEMTKGQARDAIAKIVAKQKASKEGPFLAPSLKAYSSPFIGANGRSALVAKMKGAYAFT